SESRGGGRLGRGEGGRWRDGAELHRSRQPRPCDQAPLMRILFLQQQPCVRALKYAVALRLAFPKIRLRLAYQGRTLSGWYGSGDELFERWWDLGSEPLKGLRQAGEEFRPNLIPSHNLPDSLTAIALELFAGRVPVVHDVHDLQSLRRTPYEHGF